jgi:hypothetical protein
MVWRWDDVLASIALKERGYLQRKLRLIASVGEARTTSRVNLCTSGLFTLGKCPNTLVVSSAKPSAARHSAAFEH